MQQHLGHDVAHHRQVEGLGHGRDLHPLGDAAHPREVDHDDVDRARFDHVAEGHDAPDIFAAGDRRPERRRDPREAREILTILRKNLI